MGYQIFINFSISSTVFEKIKEIMKNYYYIVPFYYVKHIILLSSIQRVIQLTQHFRYILFWVNKYLLLQSQREQSTQPKKRVHEAKEICPLSIRVPVSTCRHFPFSVTLYSLIKAINLQNFLWDDKFQCRYFERYCVLDKSTTCLDPKVDCLGNCVQKQGYSLSPAAFHERFGMKFCVAQVCGSDYNNHFL